MRKSKFGILLVFALLTLVSVVSAALPSLVTGEIIYPVPQSYYNVNIKSGGSGELTNSPPVFQDSWCVDSVHHIYANKDYTFNVVSSLTNPSFPNVIVKWKQINYVLNMRTTWGLDAVTTQAVLWHYDGGVIGSGYDPTKYNAAIAATDAFILANPHWAPGCGQVYAVVLQPKELTLGLQSQIIIVERPVPCTPTPEFPTLALPVGMIVGVLGLVYTVKTREK